ncbi:hypothetical protein GOP47_0027796 [Adiantum capillus-veneris]|nr:hypothetical protein GOP47_0027796 [Adiantum capillus-veneris]
MNLEVLLESKETLLNMSKPLKDLTNKKSSHNDAIISRGERRESGKAKRVTKVPARYKENKSTLVCKSQKRNLIPSHKKVTLLTHNGALKMTTKEAIALKLMGKHNIDPAGEPNEADISTTSAFQVRPPDAHVDDTLGLLSYSQSVNQYVDADDYTILETFLAPFVDQDHTVTDQQMEPHSLKGSSLHDPCNASSAYFQYGVSFYLAATNALNHASDEDEDNIPTTRSLRLVEPMFFNEDMHLPHCSTLDILLKRTMAFMVTVSKVMAPMKMRQYKSLSWIFSNAMTVSPFANIVVKLLTIKNQPCAAILELRIIGGRKSVQ